MARAELRNILMCHCIQYTLDILITYCCEFNYEDQLTGMDHFIKDTQYMFLFYLKVQQPQTPHVLEHSLHLLNS